MKKISLLFLTAAFALSIVATSCKKDNNTYVQGTVTVKSDDTDPIYLQLDEKTALKPTNMTKNPYGREMRAFITFIDKGRINDRIGMEWRNAEIYRIDSIRTKLPDTTISPEMDPKVYGNEQIDVYDSWMTGVEDGYLTLYFRGKWGNIHKVKHTVSLVGGTRPGDSLYFDLRHNSNDDDFSGGFHYENGLTAFKVRDLIDYTKDTTYVFTLHYNSDQHGGEHTFCINYHTSKK